MNNNHLVYIMGRGHSGSTVLDLLLGNSNEIESVGEFISGCVSYNRKCSCGKDFKSCNYWMKIRKNYEKSNNFKWEESCKQVKKISHIKYFIKILFASLNNSEFIEYAIINNKLFHSIAQNSNKRYVVDSSKEVTRGLFLLKYTCNTKIIHLVRNPESILSSNYYRIKNGKGFKFLRKTYENKNLMPLLLFMSCFGWIIGNLLAELIKIRFYNKKRVLIIRFEDLNNDSSNTLKQISDFIEVDLEPIIINIQRKIEMEIGHNIGGNHMRMQGKFYFKKGNEIKRPLPKIYKILTRLIAWPLMLKYKYRIF